mgnify:CR=1 FL=1
MAGDTKLIFHSINRLIMFIFLSTSYRVNQLLSKTVTVKSDQNTGLNLKSEVKRG